MMKTIEHETVRDGEILIEYSNGEWEFNQELGFTGKAILSVFYVIAMNLLDTYMDEEEERTNETPNIKTAVEQIIEEANKLEEGSYIGREGDRAVLKYNEALECYLNIPIALVNLTSYTQHLMFINNAEVDNSTLWENAIKSLFVGDDLAENIKNIERVKVK